MVEQKVTPVRDIHWVAGLLEGEGSFIGKEGPKGFSPVISLQMADKDIVAKVATILGSPKLMGPIIRTGNHRKEMWGCSVYGCRAVEWMMTLYVLLGERRKERIRQILTKWRAIPPNKLYGSYHRKTNRQGFFYGSEKVGFNGKS